MGSLVWDLWFEIFGLGTFVRELSLGSFRLGTFVWELSLGNFRLEIFVRDLWFGNFRSGALAYETSFDLTMESKMYGFPYENNRFHVTLGTADLAESLK